jgi:hypothetical protein
MKSLSTIIYEKLILKKSIHSEYILLDTVNIEDQWDEEDLTDTDIDSLLERDIEYFNGLLEKVDKEYSGYILYDYKTKNKIDFDSVKYDKYLTYLYNHCTDKCAGIIVKWIDGKLECTVKYATSSRTYYICPLSREGDDIFDSYLNGYDDEYFDGLSEEEFYDKFLNDKEMILKFNEEEFDLE